MFFSIIICSYNPNHSIFEKLLNAILHFGSTSPCHEVIIVDNNSSPALSQDETVQSFLSKKQNSRVITENKPGLTNARIAGIKDSNAEWLVFFDDDNEPAKGYLIEAKKIIDQYTEVGAWGPGNIHVNYVGQKENNYLDNLKPLFQQRTSSEICFDNNKVEGNVCYPYGTGLIIRRDILTVYIDEVEKNMLTMSDRKGNSLLSGGDTQILYIGLRMGFFAGSGPSINLTHHILPGKTKFINVLKLVYSVNSGQVKAYNEVFPTHAYPLPVINNNTLLKQMYFFAKRIIKRPLKFKMALLDLSKYFGMVKGQVIAGKKDNPLILNFWELIIRY